MRVLLVEDQEHKYDRTKKYIEQAVIAKGGTPTVLWTTNVEDTVAELEINDYDAVVIDMQMPNTPTEYSINRKGGIAVLDFIKNKVDSKNLRMCINSSSENTKEVMKLHGYEDITFIHNDSMYDLSEDFQDFLK